MKNNTIKWIIYTVYLTVCILTATTVTFSRFFQETYTGAEISIAQPAFAYDGSSSETIVLSNIDPETKSEYNFTVSNAENGRVSDYSLEYTVSMSTTGNIPLLFELRGRTPENGTLANKKDGGLAWTGGTMPYGQTATHSYTLIVSWDRSNEEYLDGDYSGEIDLITLNILWNQTVA